MVARLFRLLDAALGRGLFQRDDVERRFPFLDEYSDQISRLVADRDGDGPAVYEEAAADLAERAAVRPPLVRLIDSGVGGPHAAEIVVLAALVERDVRFGAVIAALQVPALARRPCLGLVATMLDAGPEEVATAAAALAIAGVVILDDTTELRAEQTVRLPVSVLRLIEGSAPVLDGIELLHAAGAPALEDVLLPPRVQAEVANVAGLVRAGLLDAIVLRGSAGTGRRSVLRAIAAREGRGVVVADSAADPACARLAGALALLSGSMLVWSTEPAIGEVATVPLPPGVGAVGALAGLHGAVDVVGADRVAVIVLPTPDAATRERLWRGTGLTAEEHDLAVISRRYAFSGGTIERVARQAAAIAAVHERNSIVVDDVRQAAQWRGRQRLEALATLLPAPSPDFVPALSGTTDAELEALVRRARHRESIAGAVGGATGDQLGRGVRALFSGPSGTGKTLAATALGVRLHLDVYRADLASLVDKYIGETERRLDQLLSRAEELDVVLLIDEGDALLTRRTSVRTSNDRYANLETDYLLQRLESFTGLVVITTNAAHLIDPAFQRRLDTTVTFTAPGPDERRLIWELHLPEHHTVSNALLDELATRCRFTGGQIRNATVYAALLGLDRGVQVNDAAVLAAVQREFDLGGQTNPLARVAAQPSPFTAAMAAR